MKKYFLTSDVHSYYDELLEVLKSKSFDIDNPDHVLCVLGDLFDRGPKSKELLAFVKGLGDRFIYVRGNHEDLLNDCINDILGGFIPGRHHVHNGTVKTIAQLCDVEESQIMAWPKIDPAVTTRIQDLILPIIAWINEKSVDYAVIDEDFILVHGWAPTIGDCLDFRTGELVNPKIPPLHEWDNLGILCWNRARWDNGMALWNKGILLQDKTICCGHWGTNYGWSHIRQEQKEWPAKNRKDWKKSFEPFIDNGIIALDSTVAYSGFLNCVILEEIDDVIQAKKMGLL